MCCQVPQRTSPTGPKNTPNPARLGNVPSGILRKNSPAARNGGTEADAQILELNQQLMDLKLTVDGLEKERDFYFSKLRDIELICQEHENENSPIITGIVSVLYATEEGFAPPEDDELEEQPPEDQDEICISRARPGLLTSLLLCFSAEWLERLRQETAPTRPFLPCSLLPSPPFCPRPNPGLSPRLSVSCSTLCFGPFPPDKNPACVLE
ncbi:microtubule-associated protein RP/EB family member 3 [Manacus vitellinus]|uniref:microtubule-associated protein RP/EB family member 3 n=1 Tax=Manacus vitellinus TaxID=328815 RepID=UPI00115E4336|nr:microtubule-associated protein RP/EB family member 3 [Manacus vitellinus]